MTTEELIRDFSEGNFSDWCRGKFADFVPKSERLDEGDFSRARQIGYVRTLAEDGVNRPLLVAAVQVPGELGERSSRKRQFDFARKALQRAMDRPPGQAGGLFTQGLFVFYGENGDFRMSLISGRVEGGKLAYNSFKRQTFFVRHNEVNRTFLTQMEKGLGDYEALCAAFSIEALTKQFYNELFAWYEWALSDEMDVRFPNDIHTDMDNRELIPEHMIRLITRLMFTWFIKQKHLVPEEIFRVEELRKLLKDFDPDSETEGNYYNAILQNLFFATLNNKIEDRDFAANGTTRAENENHYGVKTLLRNPKGDTWFKVSDDKILKLFEKVPFLNGGLFECLDRPEDEKSKRILYYDGFSREEKVKGKLTRAFVPNCLFFDKDDGLIPLFQRYNFTVEENSPNDAEVALDPELLGKVFENLLGAYNPETKETARKQSGSFYTPREIVSYMVDESLKQYLKTQVQMDDAVLAPLFEEDAKVDLPTAKRKELAAAIRSVKILDPACGSGAFPMGALHRLLDLLVKLEGQAENLYDLKLHLIENCIYGVDIQTIAVQISKLRFFISLVCEQEPNSRKDNFGILPLPNLETKFVCANTLIGLEKNLAGDLNLEDEEIAKLRKELWDIRHRHFLSKSSQEKHACRRQDKVVREKIQKRIVAIASTPDKGKITHLEESIRKLEAEKGRYRAEKWETISVPTQGDLFGGKSNNVAQKIRVDTNKAKREELDERIERCELDIAAEKGKKTSRELVAAAEKLAAWNPYDQNESSPFFDPEWMYGVKDGFDVAIGNPPYGASITNEHKEWFNKSYKHQDYQLDSYLLFIEKCFELAAPARGVALIIPNTWLLNLLSKKIRKWIFSEKTIRSIVHFTTSVFTAVVDNEVVVFTNSAPTNSHAISVSVFGDDGYEEPFFVPQERWLRRSGESVNILERPEFTKLADKLRSFPLLDRICVITQGAKPFQVGKGKPPQTPKIVESKPFVSSTKKNKTFRPLLRGSLIQRYQTLWNGDYWISFGDWLAEPRYSANYDAPEKIVIRQTGDSLLATLDEEQFIIRDNLYSIVHRDGKADLRFILGLLNSKLLNWFYQKAINPEEGEALAQIKRGHLAQLPIVSSQHKESKKLVVLVDRILAEKRKSLDADTRVLEQNVDQIVYALYGLTNEEIALVEGISAVSNKAEKKIQAPRTVKAKSKTVLVDDEGLD